MHSRKLGRPRFIPIALFLLTLCGCGEIKMNGASGLLVTPGTISFGEVAIGKTLTANVTVLNRSLGAVELSDVTSSASAFSPVAVKLPATIPSGATYTVTVKFTPQAAGSTNAQLRLITNQSESGDTAIDLNGSGTPGIASLACSLSSFSGSGNDDCTVTLNVPAPTGGFTINLSSSLYAVSLPASVTVPANATAVRFNATVSSVSSAQSVMLTASAAGSSSSFALQLVAAGSALSFNAASISFGKTALNNPVTQTIVATASGTLPVTITSATSAGTGFTIIGTTLPITLNPGQGAALNVQFNPRALGSASGSLSITSSALTSTTATIALTGTGVAYEVHLTWNAPAGSSSPISGYKIFRAAGGSSTYQLLNSAAQVATNYVDNTVQPGMVYDYMVETVAAGGAVSGPSNTTTVTIP